MSNTKYFQTLVKTSIFQLQARLKDLTTIYVIRLHRILLVIDRYNCTDNAFFNNLPIYLMRIKDSMNPMNSLQTAAIRVSEDG